ncbi:hypothetical protein [Vibrio harveyi]|uniref:hypothetical protein n=1 Tax=Vibrio harveyi TaxID=669 RepID=UPI003CEF56AD
MIPNNLKAIVTSVHNNEVHCCIYRLDDKPKVMEVSFDLQAFLHHANIILVKLDGTTERRNALLNEVKPGVTFLWKRNIKISSKTPRLGVFLCKMTEKAEDNVDNPATDKSRPSKIQLFMREKAANLEEDNDCSGDIETREVPENDDPNSIQQKMRRMAESKDLDANIENFRHLIA